MSERARQVNLTLEPTKPRVYMAGPIQHAEDNGVWWREALPHVAPEFEWVNPLAKYNSAIEEVKWPAERVVEEDLALIDGADALLVNWVEVPSAGTGMEVFYANRELGIPVVVRFEDPVNISPWMEAHADVVSREMEECLEALGEVLL